MNFKESLASDLRNMASVLNGNPSPNVKYGHLPGLHGTPSIITMEFIYYASG